MSKKEPPQPKYQIPRRQFDGPRAEHPVGIRMPVKLHEVLKEISTEYGWNLSDLILMVLDQFAQQARKKR